MKSVWNTDRMRNGECNVKYFRVKTDARRLPAARLREHSDGVQDGTMQRETLKRLSCTQSIDVRDMMTTFTSSRGDQGL